MVYGYLLESHAHELHVVVSPVGVCKEQDFARRHTVHRRQATAQSYTRRGCEGTILAVYSKEARVFISEADDYWYNSTSEFEFVVVFVVQDGEPCREPQLDGSHEESR